MTLCTSNAPAASAALACGVAPVPYAVYEAKFASEPDGYLAELGGLHVVDHACMSFSFGPRLSYVEALEGAADWVQEADQALVEGAPAPEVFVSSIDAQHERHVLTWLTIVERPASSNSVAKSPRQAHEWTLICDRGRPLTIWFEHGALGLRCETQPNLAQALRRLSQLVAAKVDWQDFGDPQSRRTLLHKGQFYWRCVAEQRDIPVDNFVYRTPAGVRLKLEGVSSRAVVNLSIAKTCDAWEWQDDYAQALQRMATLFEDTAAAVPAFVADASVELENPQTSLTDALAGVTLADGRFVVESIFESQDVLDAPVLVFKTGEGREVLFCTPANEPWSVRTELAGANIARQSFSLTQRGAALRALAAALQGDATWWPAG